MEIRDCNCGNPENGFPCTCEHEFRYSGDVCYNCDICGTYIASQPICELCEIMENEDAEEVVVIDEFLDNDILTDDDVLIDIDEEDDFEDNDDEDYED